MSQQKHNFRKRPKISLKNFTLVPVLQELARCLISLEKTHIVRLNNDSVEFLKAMDSLDLSSGVPSVVDDKMFANVCKHRRQKIENEVKVQNFLDTTCVRYLLVNYICR